MDLTPAEMAAFKVNHFAARAMNSFAAHVEARKYHLHEMEMEAKFTAAVNSPALAYTRTRYAGGSAYVTAYHFDRTSPTGVLAAASCLNFDRAVAILDARGASFPLSPTEGLQSSGAVLE